ncbi:MAG: hypothetical protein HUK02_09105 [Bacteroidaceae bacterium]|nr:hypothetical protein [Bacteroidaceae bacterium]
MRTTKQTRQMPTWLMGVVIVLMTLLTTAVHAQGLHTIYIKYRAGKTTLSAGGVQLFTYRTKAQADQAARMITSGNPEGARRLQGYLGDAVTETEDGACYIKAADTGWMVVDPIKLANGEDYDVVVVSTRPTNSNGDVVYTLVSARGESDEKTIQLKEVESLAKKKLKNAQDKAGMKMCGNSLFYPPVRVKVDSAYAHDDARFVLSPVLYKDGKPVQMFPPTVLDGKQYHSSQLRRMGYNLANDPLSPYVEEGHYMQTHRPDTVWTKAFRIDNYDPTARYKGVVRYSFENYNHVYYEGSYEWWDGRVMDPMRFLDWEEVKKSIPIDVDRYARVGRVERHSSSMSGLTVNYPVGSNEIDMDDSVTIENINLIRRRIESYYGDDAFIAKMVIKGYASPEGGSALNERLCKARAASLSSWVRSTYGNMQKLQRIESEGYVSTWAEVADYLEQTIGSDEAKQIAQSMRAIVAQQGTADAQWAQIRKCEWYSFVATEVLPHMRRVDIEFSYVTERVKTQDEIADIYKTQGQSYLQTAKPYEFYELLRQYDASDDLATLEQIAKAAYASVTEPVSRTDREVTRRNADGTYEFYEKFSPFYERPYPLAAYELARCKFMRHEVDTVLLQQYIDWSNDGRENERLYQGQKAGWWNDEAIVVMQVLMLCEAKEYRQAHVLCDRHLGDDEKYQTLKMFVRCMDCEWDNPEVRDYVAQSSPINAAVVTMAADDDPDCFRKALRILDSDPALDQHDPTVLYLRAICRFRKETDADPEALPYFAYNIWNDPDGVEGQDFAAPMLEACRIAPGLVQRLENDGYFNDSYRLLVWFFWKRLNEGLDMATIATEYNNFRAQYMAQRSQVHP